MQVYIESLIRFGKLQMFLNWSQSICDWAVLSLIAYYVLRTQAVAGSQYR